MTPNHGLRNEVSALTAIAAIGSLLFGRTKLASRLGLIAIGTRLLPLPRYDFRNRTIIITGGSRGLGFVLADELLRRGANVSILARDLNELSRALKKLEPLGPERILAIECDVTNPEQLRNAFLKTWTYFRRIDVLINNAGTVTMAPFEATNDEDFTAQMELHFYAALTAIRFLLPYFKAKGGGRIVNISSIGGKVPVPHMAPYCASKFALSGFSQSIATELKRHGVIVTTVHPGLMRTGSTIQAVFEGDAEKEYTGAASRSWFDRQAWSWPLRQLRNRAEKEFNQKEKFDAEYNLNIPTWIYQIETPHW